jgi:thiamine biosynthesis protein ThiI
MVKGASAKKQMIAQLTQNLHTLLDELHSEIDIKRFNDKIEIYAPDSVASEISDILTRTPGIETVLEAVGYEPVDTLDAIKELTGKTIASRLKNKRFVVRAKRTGTHPFTSSDIERGVGGYLLAKTEAKRVDLHNPEYTVYLEVINRQLNIVTARRKGLGGFPIGTQGDVLSLMSGGFDSTVASYLSIRRGMKTHYLFFNLGGTAHEIGVKQVSYYLWQRFGASHPVRFITVPFEDVVTEIFRSVPKSYMGVMLKRLMLQAAERIADTMEIDALVTGESVAQVSSQTLRNLALIDQATSKLVLRPLSMSDKGDIIRLADTIGTRRFAESMPEYCGVISQNPVTHGSFKRIEKVAAAFDENVLHRAVNQAVHIDIRDIPQAIGKDSNVEIVTTPDAGTHLIVDIRPEDDTLQSECEVRKIPFFKLKNAYASLPKDKTILLYCDKGIMSRLHAEYLNEAFNADIKVYRPS